jgi:hypothetical protein
LSICTGLDEHLFLFHFLGFSIFCYTEKFILFFVFSTVCTVACGQNNTVKKQKDNITFPELMVFSDEFENFFSSKNKIEKIVSDKYWLEGPVWVEALNGLLFNDIPENKIYFWNKQKGLSVWLEGSGFANGLSLNANGDLLLGKGIIYQPMTQRGRLVK